MYHPTVINASLRKLEEQYKYSPKEYSIPEVISWTKRLAKREDEKQRVYTQEEQRFIINELMLTKASFQYWAERYAYINKGGIEVDRAYPLYDSQKLLIDKLAQIELECFNGEREDGILINILKARQMGFSTIAELLIAHRATTQNNIFGLIASDVPRSSAHLFDMFERVVDRLPWFLKPEVKEHVKNDEMLFDGGSHIYVGAGKSTRGTTGERGQLGRSMTVSCLHLSELSTWEDTKQIDSALMPIVPKHPRTLAFFESTAKGRNNWWHQAWNLSVKGVGRITPVFFPWFAEPNKYRSKTPVNWEPSEKTLLHAKRCEDIGPRWLGKKVDLTREQLYWYESTRQTFEEKGALKDFLEEYAADPEECFQFSGRSIFTVETIERIDTTKKPIKHLLEVASSMDIQQRHFDISAGTDIVNIPPGYGLRPLKGVEAAYILAQPDTESKFNHLMIWEAPRRDQLYIMSVDVSEGIGQDRSVIDITRVATIQEPDEQVAQWVSDSTDPIDLAAVADAIGRLYKGSDGQEALAAVEANNHGLATLSEMQRHLGYTNFFIWRYEDKADESRQQSNSIGWYTTRRTRPIIITRYVKKVRTVDPETQLPDYKINSPITIEELRDFQTSTTIAEAEAAIGANDDAIMTGAIGVHVAQTLHYEHGEPLDERRRRLSEEKRRKTILSEARQMRRDYINTDVTSDEMEWKLEYEQ